MGNISLYLGTYEFKDGREVRVWYNSKKIYLWFPDGISGCIDTLIDDEFGYNITKEEAEDIRTWSLEALFEKLL